MKLKMQKQALGNNLQQKIYMRLPHANISHPSYSLRRLFSLVLMGSGPPFRGSFCKGLKNTTLILFGEVHSYEQEKNEIYVVILTHGHMCICLYYLYSLLSI